MARMEDLLMGGGDSSDEDAAEGASGAPAAAAPPSSSSSTNLGGDSKTELTNRLKNLYSTPAPSAGSSSSSGGGGQSVSGATVAASNVAIPSAESGGRSSNAIPSTQVQAVGAVASERTVPPMVQTAQRSSSGSAQQQQQQQQPSHQPQQSVGRVPAPLPKARNSIRSAPPSNRLASVPVSSTPSGVPPPSPMTSTQQQQQQMADGSSRQQYAQQQQRPVPSHLQQQQQRPPLTSTTAAAVAGRSGSSRDLTEQEKKEKERFLMFTRVLMKYLEQRDRNMHAAAKAQIKECYEKNKSGDPQFRSLTMSMKTRLRSTVGELYWKKAHDYLDHFLKQKKEAHLKDMNDRAGQGLPPAIAHRSTGIPPPTVRIPQHPQQQQQFQFAAAGGGARPTGMVRPPPLTIPIANAPTNAPDVKTKKEIDAARRKEQRNKLARDKREKAKQLKTLPQGASNPLGMSTGFASTASTPMSMVSPTGQTLTPASSSAISAASMQKGKIVAGMMGKGGVDSGGKKMKSPVARSNSIASITKKPPSVRETTTLMEMIDHATLIDVKNLPSLFTSKSYKIDISLVEEQKILLYGDAEAQARVKNVAMAATMALDATLDVEARGAYFKEVGVSSLPMTIPALYDGWGTRNVVSVRNAWAKVRLPERESRLAETRIAEEERVMRQRPMFPQTTLPISDEVSSIVKNAQDLLGEDDMNIDADIKPEMASSMKEEDVISVENDTTNHAWFNEVRAEQDLTLLLLSEATERYLKSTIEAAIDKARLRLNLQGVRLWHTLQTHAVAASAAAAATTMVAPSNSNTINATATTTTTIAAAAGPIVADNNVEPLPPPPAALIRLGCDVRRQVALSQGNAAKVYQRMEEAITRRIEDYPPRYNPNDIDQMWSESTSMADLSTKPYLKNAASTADADAKRKFAVFCGADATDPPFGRVPTEVKVILQDIDVGIEGNRMMTIGARQKRFRVGLKF